MSNLKMDFTLIKIKNVLMRIPYYVGLALIIRFLLIAFLAHNDALFIPWLSYPIVHLGQWKANIYEFLLNIRRISEGGITEISWAPNPPLSYYTMAFWLLFLQKLKLFNSSGWVYTGYSVWNIIYVTRTMFLSKGLYLLADLSSWILLRSVVERRNRKVLDYLWLFCPIILVGAYIMGQTDILSVFWFVVAIVLAKRAFETDKKKLLWSSLSLLALGVGAGYKLWPLMIIPLWAVILERRIAYRILLMTVGVVPIVITSVKFIDSKAFQRWVLFGHSSNFLSIDLIDWGHGVYWFVVLWGLVHFYFLFWGREWNFRDLWRGTLVILISLFTLNVNWEFYWLTWAIPVIFLAIIEENKTVWLYVYQCFYFLVYFVFGWNFSIAFFSPFSRILATNAFTNMRVLYLIHPELTEKLLSVLFSLFIAASWGLVILVFVRKEWVHQKTDICKSRWVYTMPILLLIVVLGIAVFIGLSYATEPISTIWAGFLQVLRSDPIFFVSFFVILMGIIIFTVIAAANQLRPKELTLD